MKLRGAQHGHAGAGCRQGLLRSQLAAVVGHRKVVDPDDGDVNQMHGRPCGGGGLGQATAAVDRHGSPPSGVVGAVDHDVSTPERHHEPGARGQVEAGSSTHGHSIMPAEARFPGHARAQVTEAPRDDDAHPFTMTASGRLDNQVAAAWRRGEMRSNGGSRERPAAEVAAHMLGRLRQTTLTCA